MLLFPEMAELLKISKKYSPEKYRLSYWLRKGISYQKATNLTKLDFGKLCDNERSIGSLFSQSRKRIRKSLRLIPKDHGTILLFKGATSKTTSSQFSLDLFSFGSRMPKVVSS